MERERKRGFHRSMALPDHVVEEIFSRLSVEELARTSVLSRAWHRFWQSVPALSFDSWRTLPAAVIDKVLLAHAAPIESLSIRLSIEDVLRQLEEEGAPNHIDGWLALLSRRHPDALTSLRLDQWFMSPHTSLAVLSSFRSLTHLSLQYCGLPPADLSGDFPLLRTLVLRHVALYGGDQLSDLLSGCPSLEMLRLCSVKIFGPRLLRIPNPKLRCFHADLVPCHGITFVGGQILENVLLHLITCHEDEEGVIDLAHLFGNSVCTGTLRIREDRIAHQALATFTSFPFQQLKVLIMYVNWGIMESMHLIHYLVRSAPNLQRLRLKQVNHTYMSSGLKYRFHHQDFEPQVFWNQQSTIRLDKLRTVEMRCSMFIEPQVGFIQFLLTRAPVLEKLLLVRDDGAESWLKEELEELNRRQESALEVLNKCHKLTTQTQIQIRAGKK